MTNKSDNSFFNPPREHSFLRFLLALFLAAVTTYLLFLTLPEEARSDELLNNSRQIRKCLVSMLWLSFFFCLSLRFSLPTRSAMIVVLLLPSALFAYIGIAYKLPFTIHLAFDFFESKAFASEASNFISMEVIFLSLAFIASVVGISALLFAGMPAKSFYKSRTALYLFLFLTIIPIGFTHVRQSIYPLKKIEGPIKSYDNYIKTIKPLLAKLKTLENQIDETSRTAIPAPATTVFLHIGESVRADHLSLNAYKRNTSPKLLKEEQNGNLVNFAKAISFSASTRESVVGILTPSSLAAPELRHQSLMQPLKKYGISSHAMLSSMSRYPGNHDVPITILAQGCSNAFFTPKRAFDTLPELEHILASLTKEGRFLFYYGEGSHTPFISYDRDRFEVFKPTSNSLSKDERCINNYDNSILATDAYIAAVLERLRNKNAMYIFTSDHGEALGDQGLWVRREDAITMESCRHVPFVIWVSEHFKKENAEKYAVLLKNREKFDTVSHDHIYHTVLGLFGVVTPSYDSKLDLFSENAVGCVYRVGSKMESNKSIFSAQ